MKFDDQTTALIQQMISALGPIAPTAADDNYRRASPDSTFPIDLTKAQMTNAANAVAGALQALAASAALPPPAS